MNTPPPNEQQPPLPLFEPRPVESVRVLDVGTPAWETWLQQIWNGLSGPETCAWPREDKQ